MTTSALEDLPDSERPPTIVRDAETQASKSSSSRRSNIKPYEPDTSALNLYDLLTTWRAEEYRKRYRGNVFMGLAMVMSDEIIQRLVDVAHAGKLMTVDDIIDQTGWTVSSARRYGPEILDIVRLVRPDHFTIKSADSNPEILCSSLSRKPLTEKKNLSSFPFW